MIDTSVQVSLNGLTFNGPAGEDGVVWTVETVQGLGGPAARYEPGGKVQQDGLWATTAYRDGAPMGLSGQAEFRSPSDVPRVVRTLDAAVSLRRVPLTMHWPGRDLTRNVRRDGLVEVETHNDRSLSWSCTVVADDPSWYRGGPAPVPGPVPGVVFPSDGWVVYETGFPATSGGMSFPFHFPFAFDATTVSGDINLQVESGGWWLFVLEAGTEPLVDPRVVVVDADGAHTLEWGITMRPREILVVDPQRQTSLLQGQTSRPPRKRQWATPTAGPTVVQFRSGQPSDATLRVYFIPAE